MPRSTVLAKSLQQAYRGREGSLRQCGLADGHESHGHQVYAN